MEGIGNAIVSGFIFFAVIAFIVGGLIIGGIWYFMDKDYIESKTLIKPEIRLETDGQNIDTVYIYREQ